VNYTFKMFTIIKLRCTPKGRTAHFGRNSGAKIQKKEVIRKGKGRKIMNTSSYKNEKSS
jgi:hypothetical protein